MIGVKFGRYGRERVAYRIWAGKPEVKKQLGRPCCGMDKIKMDLKDVAWNDVDWVDLAKDRDTWRAVVKTVMNLEVL